MSDKIRVAVCDYPGPYEFPPRGYGGAERRLWAAAVGALQSGADVHLLGPQWRVESPEFTRHNIRLESRDNLNQLKDLDFDLFLVGHEYSSHPRWREVYDQLDADLAIFQGVPDFVHKTGAFDGVRTRLYCHSFEMCEIYKDHKPIQGLAMGLGIDEEMPPTPAKERSGLIWVGRLDADKAPHIAARAAAIAGKRITFIGPVFDEGYMSAHAEVFSSPNVFFGGELAGIEKTFAIQHASSFVYTVSRPYIEAAGMVFSEALRAGTPMAALTWREGTSVDVSICSRTGSVAAAEADGTDEEAAEVLAQSITSCDRLDPEEVRRLGRKRFDPSKFFNLLSNRY